MKVWDTQLRRINLQKTGIDVVRRYPKATLGNRKAIFYKCKILKQFYTYFYNGPLHG